MNAPRETLPQLECFDCMSAAAGMHHGFRMGCKGCEARAIARSPDYAQSERLGKLTAGYRTLLSITGLTHEQVKAAAETDAMR